MHPILGLDIGGANLKAAHTGGAARSVPFALWKMPGRLSEQLVALARVLPAFDRLAVTMTGELCDCFETKDIGVRTILDAVRHVWPGTPTRVWTNRGHFVSLDDAMEMPRHVAAANWLAVGTFAAHVNPDGHALLVDTGSTTTDIVFLNHGVAEPRGRTDLERLRSGELVYTGIRRTPICAVLGTEVAAEFFATMLDAYVIAGLIAENAEDHDTADGRPATRCAALARMARMLCADGIEIGVDEIVVLARRALQKQWDHVSRAIQGVLQDRPPIERVVLTGAGEILGSCVVDRNPCLAELPITSLAATLDPERSMAACAYAVAMLAAEEAN